MTAASPDVRVAELPSTLRLGTVHLTVTRLERSIGFYEGSLGLRLHWRAGDSAAVGAGGEDLLVLVEEPSAQPAGRHAGLYHVALLHPSREELARSATRLALTRTPIYGASDHGVSEAIYLPDPDGNELELAADRPRQEWPDLTQWGGGPRPLDLPGLLASVAGEEPRGEVGEGLRIGHLHLHVGDLGRGLDFYSRALGFEPQVQMPTAAFLSTNGYHHHVAVNTWRGEGVPATPANTVGLRHWTVVLDEPDEVADVVERVRSAGFEPEERKDGVLVRDQWNIAVLFRAAPYPKPRSLAWIETPTPSRYVLQVAEHFAHRLDVSFDERAATIRFPLGQAELHAERGRLVLEAIAENPDDLTQLEVLVSSHLERFAFREQLEVGWRRPADQG